MFKKLLAFFAAMTVAAAFAAIDVNKATPAELDGIKGIGPSISTKIVDERKKGNFKSWEDFIERVKGIGEGNAAKFSAEGLTVSGAGYKGAAAAPAKKEEKKDDKGENKEEKKEDENKDENKDNENKDDKGQEGEQNKKPMPPKKIPAKLKQLMSDDRQLQMKMIENGTRDLNKRKSRKSKDW